MPAALSCFAAVVLFIGFGLFRLAQTGPAAPLPATTTEEAMHAETVRATVEADLARRLSLTEAGAELEGPPCGRLRRTGELTSRADLATRVQDAPGGPLVPACVRYELDPADSTGAYTLRRRVRRDGGFDEGVVLSRQVAHFLLMHTESEMSGGGRLLRVRLEVAS